MVRAHASHLKVTNQNIDGLTENITGVQSMMPHPTHCCKALLCKCRTLQSESAAMGRMKIWTHHNNGGNTCITFKANESVYRWSYREFSRPSWIIARCEVGIVRLLHVHLLADVTSSDVLYILV